MLKNISKVVLASFLLCGAAKATDVYKDELNTFTVNVKAKAYVGYDEAGFNTHNRGREVAPVEFTGQIEVESFYYRKITDNLSGNAFVKLEIPTFGYSGGPYGFSNANDLNNHISTFQYINRAALELDHKYIGRLLMGRYKSLYSYVIDYSDVDIFIGNPAHNYGSNFLFGVSPETGALYITNLFSDKVTLAASVDLGKDSMPVMANNYIYNKEDSNKNLNFKKDYQFSVAAKTTFLDNFNVGAMYKFTEFRVSSSTDPKDNNDLGRQGAHNAIGGLSYTIGSTLVGATASVQHAKLNTTQHDHKKLTAYGVEVGASYDISGMGTGFRPSAQFDLRKSYTKHKERISNTKTKNHYTDVLALEVGLSYYVTPYLYYQAAVVADLRNKDEIARGDGIDRTKSKVTSHHYLGGGVVYKF